MKQRSIGWGSLLLCLLSTTVAFGQAVPSATPVAASLPEAYKTHAVLATAAAQGIAKNVLNLCNIPTPRPAGGPGGAAGGGGPGGPTAGAGANATPVFEPGKAFDNLYYVGLRAVSAWAIKTSDGIILIDALNNAKDAEDSIVGGLKKLGLDPAQIKYLIVTHGHGDHYGGAQYLVDRFHPRVISSEADWKIMAGPRTFINPAWDAPPKQDMTIIDGQKLSLGDTTITLYVTPGHTPGTISIILPVKDNGQAHTAALWGGTAFNFEPVPANFRAYGQSADRFKEIAQKAGADIILSNHGFVDDTLVKLPVLMNRKAGDPNPYIVGTEAVQNFFTVAGECAKAREAVAAQ